jgi:hypothetical protein
MTGNRGVRKYFQERGLTRKERDPDFGGIDAFKTCLRDSEEASRKPGNDRLEVCTDLLLTSGR